MSETKFTKGEWEFLYEDDFVQVMAGNMTICYEPHPNSEELSNAHLIAAAPEMYELLESIAVNEMMTGDDAFSEQINELLAKARGEKC